MANVGQGDPHRNWGVGDPYRTAVGLHVDDHGGLVRADDGRDAGHDGSGNDAVANVAFWPTLRIGRGSFMRSSAITMFHRAGVIA